MVRRTVYTLLIVALVVMAVVPVTPASAQTKLVEIYLWAGEGPIWEYYTADSTSNIGLYYYWFAKTPGQVQAFLDSVTVAVSLNGEPLFDTRESAHVFWAPVEPFIQRGVPLYRAEWSSMLVPLDPGEYTVKFTLSLDAVVEDGVAAAPFGPGVITSTTHIITVVESGAVTLPDDDTGNVIKPTNVVPSDPDKIYDQPVVGTFVDYAQAYWAPEPGKVVTPEVYFSPGTTLWVFGMDSTRKYYKVLIDIVYLWVPVNTIGPTYDDTWGGRPLPNIVVAGPE